MIVDFVQIKRKLSIAADNFVMAEAKKHMPLVSQIQIVMKHEGDEASYETVDKEVNDIDFVPVMSETKPLTREEMAQLSMGDIEQLLAKLAEDFARKSERFALQRMGEILNAAGQTFNENKPFDNESVVDDLEKIQIDFDDTRDKPHLPSIVLSPDTLRRLKDEKEKMSEEEIHNLEIRRQRILDLKYEEYVSRENNRKLVD
jgi:hypothetical protein